MADTDEYDIDIYGDDQPQAQPVDTSAAEYDDNNTIDANIYGEEGPAQAHTNGDGPPTDQLDGTRISDGDEKPPPDYQPNAGKLKIEPTSGTTSQPVAQQGVKRKQAPDARDVDPGASSALVVSEINWWTNDDDVRGWANRSGCEDELREITFNEHKVNGKSKG